MGSSLDLANAIMMLAVVLGAGALVVVLLRFLGRHEVRLHHRR